MVEATKSSTLAVPNVLYVSILAGESAIVHVGPAAGWIVPRGIRQWEREVHVVARDALTDDLRQDLGITMPNEQIPAAKLPLTHKAASASPLVGVAGTLATRLPAKGVRVHTVGFDRISGGFYYFAEGGTGEPVRIQGDLIEMSGSVLESASNADLEVYLDGLIDRLLVEFSGGELNEMSVELAERLPKAAADGTGMTDVDVDAFEREATGLATGAERYEPAARSLAEKLVEAGKKGDVLVKVPLFGEAKRQPLAAVDLEVGGARKKLPAQHRWVVSGAIREEAAAAPVVAKAVVVEKPAEAKPAAVVAKPVEAKPVEAKPVVEKPVVAAKPVVKAATPSPRPATAAPRPEKSPEPAKAAPVSLKPEPKVEAKPTVEPKVEAKVEAPKAELEAPRSVPPPKKGGKAAAKQAKLDAKRAEKEAKRAEAKVEKPAESKRPEKLAPKSERAPAIAKEAAKEKEAPKKEAAKKEAAPKKEAKEATEDAKIAVPGTESSNTWKIALAVVAALVVAYFVYMNVMKK